MNYRQARSKQQAAEYRHRKGAAREISTSRLKLTATFASSMQRKHRIAPVPDFDER
ncbi:MAG: hypothetical protein ACLTMP_11945 [Eggerthella lenta]